METNFKKLFTSEQEVKDVVRSYLLRGECSNIKIFDDKATFTFTSEVLYGVPQIELLYAHIIGDKIVAQMVLSDNIAQQLNAYKNFTDLRKTCEYKHINFLN